jgi:Putative zinc-finger
MGAGLVQPAAIREGDETMVNCEQVWREVSNYVDGDVDAALRSSMDEHFRTCKRCASVLAGTRNVVQLYGDERMLEVPAGFGRRLEKRLAKNAPEKGRGWSSWSAWLVPVAAMALIAGTLLMTSSSRNGHPLRSQHAEQAKDIPPDMVVVVSSGAKLFHVPGCEFIHDKASERTMTAKEAMQEGYVPCPRCLRQYLKTGLSGHSGAEVADSASAEAEEEQEELLSRAGH